MFVPQTCSSSRGIRVLLVASNHKEWESYVERNICSLLQAENNQIISACSRGGNGIHLLWEVINQCNQYSTVGNKYFNACGGSGWESPPLKVLATVVYAMAVVKHPAVLPIVSRYRGLPPNNFWQDVHGFITDESIQYLIPESLSQTIPDSLPEIYGILIKLYPQLDLTIRHLLSIGDVHEIFEFMSHARDIELVRVVKSYNDSSKIIVNVGSSHLPNLSHLMRQSGINYSIVNIPEVSDYQSYLIPALRKFIHEDTCFEYRSS